ncbi:hypothetical protein BGX34_011695 [Mortierella sp. NVP85]|nr:hypothetical protein BGX34_011695 [Mortierella sp. NVP85]
MARNPGKPYTDFEEQDLTLDVSDKLVNKFDIYCPQENCRCKILLASAGTLVQRPKSKLALPNLPGAAVSSIEDNPESEKNEAAEHSTTNNATEGESGAEADVEELQSFWKVQDMMAFENIGFSRRLPNQIQLLSCADCDIGPLGYHDASTSASNATKEYLIAINRVRYTSP